jgi:phosphomannomutase
MVTASHNPPEYNGLKFGNINEPLPVSTEEIELVINSQAAFEELVEKIQIEPNRKPLDCILGRDTRPTSHHLSELIKYHLLIQVSLPPARKNSLGSRIEHHPPNLLHG